LNDIDAEAKLRRKRARNTSTMTANSGKDAFNLQRSRISLAPSASTAHSRPRFRALDGLRGIAAVLVVFLHMQWPNHLSDTNFVRHGYLAVDLFFILSGLVIASNYADRIRDFRDVQAFIYLRFFRLYPLHIAVVAAFFFLAVAKLFVELAFGITPETPPFTGGDSFGALAANILLIHGLHTLNLLGWNGPSWSISCEFAAYLLFGVFAVAGLARSRLFFVVAPVIAAAIYIVMALERRTLDVTYDWGILRCIAGFMLGMLVSNFARKDIWGQSAFFAGTCEIVVAIAILLTMGLASGWAVVFVIPLFVMEIASVQSDRGPVARLMTARPIQFLGRISYSIYMVHFLLIVLLLIVLKRVVPTSIDLSTGNKIIAMSPWVGDLLAIGMLAGVLASAATTYAFIEEPARLFGRRLVAAWGKQGSYRLSASSHNV
jgi:peptidoglycan/LPS O-acetylase OafA/YrhL